MLPDRVCLVERVETERIQHSDWWAERRPGVIFTVICGGVSPSRANSQLALPFTFDSWWWSNYLAYITWVCYSPLGTAATATGSLSLIGAFVHRSGPHTGVISTYCPTACAGDRALLQACTRDKWGNTITICDTGLCFLLKHS